MEFRIVGKSGERMDSYQERSAHDFNLQEMSDIDLSEDGNQLPTPEEHKAQMNQCYRPPVGTTQKIGKRWFRRIVWIALGTGLALLIGFIAKAARHDNNTENEPISPNEAASFVTISQIMHQVIQQGWSEPEHLADPQSPQSRAVEWLGRYDTLFEETTDTTALQERYAVVVFYFALNGPEWNQGGLNFLQPNVHICEWFQMLTFEDQGVVQSVQIGIDCFCENLDPTSEIAACVQETATVKRIVLANMNLQGEVPTETRLLNELMELDLNHNFIVGTLSDGFLQIPNLQRLVLSHNSMNGPLPHSIPSKIPKIRFLDISHNTFDEELPPTIANLGLLRVFNGNHNNLTGQISVFENMGNLKALFIRNNRIGGVVDQKLLQSLPKLEVLDASENELSGVVPNIGHPTLVVLDLHKNTFENREFPDIDPTETKLQYLSLRECNLSGSPSSTILESSNSLYHLDVAKNNLSGPMPEWLSKLESLEYMDLSFGNWDKDEIPAAFSSLLNLKYLGLQHTNREGFIQYDLLVEWSKIEVIDLASNILVGALPESLGQSTPNLKKLLLHDNTLMRGLGELQNAKQLETLLVHDNVWDSTINLNQFCNLTNITIVAQPCSNTQQDESAPFCSCCICCPDMESPLCTQEFWFSDTDTGWDTKYTRARFREREVSIPDKVAQADFDPR